MNVAEHFISRLESAEIKDSPYKHTYITRAFPQDYYESMLKFLPPDESYTDRTFDNRAMVRAYDLGGFWQGLSIWMTKQNVLRAVLDLFELKPSTIKIDVRLVRDSRGYKIKPHTDIKSKLLSLLFYLAPDETQPGGGTTVMVPKDRSFTSDGLSRYPFEDFENVYTAPFLPNTMFGFPRSPVSFHGVEPTTVEKRDVLLLNLYQ